MNQREPRIGRELAAMAFVGAFDAGDLEAMALLWEQATDDPALEQLLCELSEGLTSEQEPSPGWQVDTAKVAELLKTRLPSTSPTVPVSGPLTAGDVAARIAGDDGLLGRLTPEERDVNARLIADRTPLPEPLGWSALEQWAATLAVRAGQGYWRLFQQVAIPLAMARWQRTGTPSATLAAARSTQTRGRSPSAKDDRPNEPEDGKDKR